MSGLLADIFVAGDRAKKRVRGLLNPESYANAMDYSGFQPMSNDELTGAMVGSVSPFRVVPDLGLGLLGRYFKQGSSLSKHFKNPIPLKDGGRISGITDDSQTVLFGYDKSGNQFTIPITAFRTDQIAQEAIRNTPQRKLVESMQDWDRLYSSGMIGYKEFK